MKLFQYAILWHPTDKQRDDEGKQSKIVIPITDVLAKDLNSATLLAARSIPNEYVDQIEQLEVAIRPF